MQLATVGQHGKLVTGRKLLSEKRQCPRRQVIVVFHGQPLDPHNGRDISGGERGKLPSFCIHLKEGNVIRFGQFQQVSQRHGLSGIQVSLGRGNRPRVKGAIGLGFIHAYPPETRADTELVRRDVAVHSRISKIMDQAREILFIRLQSNYSAARFLAQYAQGEKTHVSADVHDDIAWFGNVELPNAINVVVPKLEANDRQAATLWRMQDSQSIPEYQPVQGRPAA